MDVHHLSVLTFAAAFARQHGADRPLQRSIVSSVLKHVERNGHAVPLAGIPHQSGAGLGWPRGFRCPVSSSSLRTRLPFRPLHRRYRQAWYKLRTHTVWLCPRHSIKYVADLCFTGDCTRLSTRDMFCMLCRHRSLLAESWKNTCAERWPARLRLLR